MAEAVDELIEDGTIKVYEMGGEKACDECVACRYLVASLRCPTALVFGAPLVVAIECLLFLMRSISRSLTIVDRVSSRVVHKDR